MIIVPVATTIEMSPNLIDAVQTTKHLSASERLLLAKLLLDSLVVDQAENLAEQKDELTNQTPPLETVVAQIKATLPNPQQIQRASKTIDEVMANWQATPTDEPRLTAEEWEQTWWLVHQAIKQSDQARKPITDWITHENDALPVGRQSPLHNGH